MTAWNDRTRTVLCGLYRSSGALRLHEWLARCCGRQFMTILLFHRVTDVIPEDGLTVSTVRFRQICRLLTRRFHVVPLDEVFRIIHSGERMPARTVAITFDDCYHDNLLAGQILAENGLPATFFVPAGYIGTDHVFDWDRGLPRMANLGWDDLKELLRLGHAVGSHTVTHANLGAVSPEQARTEIFESRELLQDRLQQPVRWFAIPFGGPCNIRPEYIPLIAEAGYTGGVSAFGGFVEPGMDARVLPRQAVPPFRSLAHLEVYLTGCLTWLYRLKERGRNLHASLRRIPSIEEVPGLHASPSVFRQA